MNKLIIIPAICCAATLTACGGSGNSQDMSGHNHDMPDHKVPKVLTIRKTAPTNDSGEKLEASSMIKIGDQIFEFDKNGILSLDLSRLANGLNTYSLSGRTEVEGVTEDVSEGYAKVYQQFYSAILGSQTNRTSEDGVQWQDNDDGFNVTLIGGAPTAASALPTQGTVNYRGKAFNATSTGQLDYAIDFASRTGEGNITGLDMGSIILDQGNLVRFSGENMNADLQEELLLSSPEQQMMVSGVARYEDGVTDVYGMGVFGPHAEEVAGVVGYGYSWSVGAGGSIVK